MAGLKEFKEKLAQDAAFVEEARKCGDYDELVMFVEAKGFSFTEEEIEALTDLSEDFIEGIYTQTLQFEINTTQI